MATTPHFDLLIIGTGPGGEGAAMTAAKHGKSVAAIERYTRVGGGCTHWGTIPSKALRRAIYHMNLVNQSPVYKRMDVVPEYPFAELLATAKRVIDEQVDLRESFYDRNHVRLIPGQARFVDAHTVEVEAEGGQRRRFTADAFVIATGSHPYRPADVDFSHPRVLDSDTLLGLDRTPRSITIYGAGVIGCEYASMLRNMQVAVNLVNTRAHLLEFLDDEITDALGYHFCDTGIRVLSNEEYEEVEPSKESVVVSLKSGKKIKSDVFLWANGRTGNTADLGLENVGLTANRRGQLEVNESFQTGQPHIYAVGDVVGFPALASASYDQGRFAASHYCGQADYHLVHDIPTGIYTTPEISSLGKTERQLTEEKVPYEVGKSTFKTLARAQITGQQVGMLKLVFHRETLALLGIHCFGENAAEIIHIGQAIMSQPAPNNTIRYFVNTTFNYPTMAEAYRVAALDGLGRVF
ncbi:soluble pyridine nucleotide transhydrogenase [Sorangium cellulosum]|jgi:NAD(P) transhydrogenase|uniref:Soluble pyridine nucleotide transhydrogenase n=1 Tax=Sorangium cellulosum TaxID=56 RepID=A0A4P2PX01_SORCE|nr:Si-specific NAD(P)(+) transhydrogenase [Sorangium cellulosum]AUX21334.1 soluble pyridine nucleotide transhydrogenase [Sorangium cellulosum]